MSTKVYGCSDDLVEFEGNLRGEIGSISSHGDLIAFSDGTIIIAKYGKPGIGGVWSLTVLREGYLFSAWTECTDEDAAVYSDVIDFEDGILKAWVGHHAEKVQ